LVTHVKVVSLYLQVETEKNLEASRWAYLISEI